MNKLILYICSLLLISVAYGAENEVSLTLDQSYLAYITEYDDTIINNNQNITITNENQGLIYYHLDIEKIKLSENNFSLHPGYSKTLSIINLDKEKASIKIYSYNNTYVSLYNLPLYYEYSDKKSAEDFLDRTVIDFKIPIPQDNVFDDTDKTSYEYKYINITVMWFIIGILLILFLLVFFIVKD